MEALEMRMTTDLATVVPSEIGFNFTEMKTELQKRLQHYNTMVVTEDAIKDAKDDRANLRKLKEAIKNRGKEVEADYGKPIVVFKGQINELLALIDAPIASIDAQVKKFEEQEKEAKRGEIAAAYDELVPENIRQIIPLERIMDKKWLNKGTTMKSIREGIEAKVKRTNVDMALIDGVNPKYMAAVLQKYVETLDVSTALDYQDELMAAEERFRQQEEARAQRAAQAAARAGQIPREEKRPAEPVQQPVREPVREPAPIPHQDSKLYNLTLAFMPNQAGLAAFMQFLENNAIQAAVTVDFKLTQCQATAMKQFLTDNNIQYTKIK